jgi:L-2,4-diaminobutyrate decarboxylase
MLDDISQAAGVITEQFIRLNRQLDQGSLNQNFLAERTKAMKVADHAIPGPARPIDEVTREAIKIFSLRIPLNHPRHFAGIPSVPSPVSWLGDMLISTFNTFNGTWRSSPAASTIEVAIIAWLASRVGMPPSAGGLFVSGGSIANLTGMMVGRDRKLDPMDRSRGVVYVSTQVHSSVSKGLRILGFLDSQIHTIEVDAKFCMDVSVLSERITVDRAAGLVPFMIVATIGTTNTGSIDPLDAIADLAQAEGLWMHVDGAYGASVVLSKSHRHLINGLSRADSLSWDCHKWLFQTFACSLVIVQNKQGLPLSFANDPSNAGYLLDSFTEDQPNFFDLGVELTRPARAMKLWFTLQVLGIDTVGDMIDHGFTLSEALAAELSTLPDWEITSGPTMAIVTFRCVPQGKSTAELNQLNRQISQQCWKDEVACALTTQLSGRTVIRVVSINPALTTEGIRKVARAIDLVAQRLLRSL